MPTRQCSLTEPGVLKRLGGVDPLHPCGLHPAPTDYRARRIEFVPVTSEALPGLES